MPDRSYSRAIGAAFRLSLLLRMILNGSEKGDFSLSTVMFQRVRTSPTAGAYRISIDEPLSTAPRAKTRELMPPAWLNASPAGIKATGNLRAVQILLGHLKIESTVRYLGVDVEDALTLAEGTEI